uniref:Uncharacterized protein n=1 Tax=Knipowitschia caucasica TaxID=637954 RepID=A0AAV2J8P1_KNICA
MLPSASTLQPDRGPDPPDYHGYRQPASCQEAPRDPLSHNRQDSYSDRSQCPRYPDFPDRQMHGPIRGRDYPGPTNRDFDLIARHINRFEPQPGNLADPQSYLRDIDFYSKRLLNASLEDKVFLIKLTSNREVNNFIDRQSPATRRNYDNLCQALLDEYSDFGTSGTLTAALTVRQACNEPSDAYYHRLRQAYFGNQNYQNMEEDKHFKALFIQNLHPSLSLLLENDSPYDSDDLDYTETDGAEPLNQTVLQSQVNTDTWDPDWPEDSQYIPQKDVMVVQVSSYTDAGGKTPPTVRCKPPVQTLIGNLRLKGANRKLHLPMALEDQWKQDAMMDTAADISLISSDLFELVVDGGVAGTGSN